MVGALVDTRPAMDFITVSMSRTFGRWSGGGGWSASSCPLS